MANRETKTACTTGNSTRRKTTTTKDSKKRGGRTYGDNAKCSVDINKRTSDSNDGGKKKNFVVTDAKFKTSNNEDHSAHSLSETENPKNAAAYAWVKNLKVLTLKGIRKEFMTSVKSYVPEGSCDVCRDNEPANRYDDVLCLDSTRVKLKNEAEYGDYIHASYVKIHADLTYICTQGPLSNTVEQFWQMVIEQHSRIILQLCQNTEDGKEKCAEYFPPFAGKDATWVSYGRVSIKNVDRDNNVPGMAKTTKCKLQVKLGEGEKVHEITHLLYKNWPDHTVGDSPSTIVALRAFVNAKCQKKPIVCHCSAGIGRTGSFVLLDFAMYHIMTLNDKNFQMVEAVKTIRNQRRNSIQNDQQYVFVFRCIIEALLKEQIIMPKHVEKFIDDYQSLMARKMREYQAKVKRQH